jgi:hypothetical protein
MRFAACADEKLESKRARREKLVAQIQERYGVSRAVAFGKLERRLAHGRKRVSR